MEKARQRKRPPLLLEEWRREREVVVDVEVVPIEEIAVPAVADVLDDEEEETRYPYIVWIFPSAVTAFSEIFTSPLLVGKLLVVFTCARVPTTACCRE